ncbi:MAG TPA: hypothetical protein VF916_15020 [Ktedonobacterales bacterium]
MNGHNHTYDGDAPQQLQQLGQPWRIWRQCPRCLGRMTGPLAGIVAQRLLEDYTHDALCTACQDELAAIAGAPPPKHKRTPQPRRRRKAPHD